MGFWIRNAIIAIILIGLGVAFFLNKDLLLSLTTEDNQTTTVDVEELKEASANAEKEKVKVKYQQGKKSTNAAAEGLSKFYAKIYGDDSKRKVRNNIIFLPDPEGDLVNLLQAKEMMVRSFRKNWSGTKVSRTFRKGETLYQKITEYAADEGVEIIWWLNKDFIVKDPFRINKNLLKTASQIGRGISGHFPEGINTYFCYRQRTIVFISEPPTYLNDECLFLK
jgi:hypothetical protein